MSSSSEPMKQNTRFASVMSGDRGSSNSTSGGRMSGMDDSNNDNNGGLTNNNGPPPVRNSRLGMMSDNNNNNNDGPSDFGRDRGDRGGERGAPLPPLTQNSRFANVERSMDGGDRDRDRGSNNGFSSSRDNYSNNNSAPPPPLKTNKRFAAAYEENQREREAENREREDKRIARGDFSGGGQGQDDDRGGRYGGGSGFGDRGGGGRDGGGGRFGRMNNNPDQSPPENDRTTFILPELPKHLQPKKKVEPVLPPVHAPLTLPGEDEDAARARVERRKIQEEEKAKASEKAAEEAKVLKAAEQAAVAEKANQAIMQESNLIAEFTSGTKLGSELAKWCTEHKEILPSVEKLVFSLLDVREKKNPDMECAWAQADQFGAALIYLTEDNLMAQMQVLWGIQLYCDSQGFPKLNDEYLVQSMFRAMYKYDLADSEAFDEWKEDESEDHPGKMQAIIQTTDWFNWLQDDDDDDDDDDEGEDYDEEEE